MYTVKLFSGAKVDALQDTINDWLKMNKDIHIHCSNLVAEFGKVAPNNGYNFYILYTSPEAQAEELKEMAAAVTHEQSIEVKEINPEILKASS